MLQHYVGSPWKAKQTNLTMELYWCLIKCKEVFPFFFLNLCKLGFTICLKSNCSRGICLSVSFLLWVSMVFLSTECDIGPSFTEQCRFVKIGSSQVDWSSGLTGQFEDCPKSRGGALYYKFIWRRRSQGAVWDNRWI